MAILFEIIVVILLLALLHLLNQIKEYTRLTLFKIAQQKPPVLPVVNHPRARQQLRF